jgi:hypothetical protein
VIGVGLTSGAPLRDPRPRPVNQRHKLYSSKVAAPPAVLFELLSRPVGKRLVGNGHRISASGITGLPPHDRRPPAQGDGRRAHPLFVRAAGQRHAGQPLRLNSAPRPTRRPPRVPRVRNGTLGEQRLRPATCTRAGGQRPLELAARGDVELVEHLTQVVGNRVLADEQPLADLRVRETGAGEARDLRLLDGELLAGPTLRLRTRAPVAIGSRSARPANASIPIAMNISNALAVEEVGAGLGPRGGGCGPAVRSPPHRDSPLRRRS